MSRGFAHYFFICTELTQLCSFFGFPGLHMLGRIKRTMHRENYNSEVYHKSYKFIYWNKYVHKCYLAEPGVRCSSHTSLSSICLLSGMCWVWSLQPYQDTQKQADDLRLSTYIIREWWCQWNREHVLHSEWITFGHICVILWYDARR